MQCAQQECSTDAVSGFWWPGRKGPAPCCAHHENVARGIAQVMGFVLQIVDVAVLERVLVNETVILLKDWSDAQ